MSQPLRVLEFYSGIGGLHVALQKTGVPAQVIAAYDWDQNACQVYAANHGKHIAQKTDITTLTATQLAAHHADVWLLSPACQPYTVLNPDAKGAEDPRARSFLYLVQTVLPELKSLGCLPKYLLVENVAGFETSTTRQILASTLSQLDYHIRELLLTPIQFGIPNSRLRYYCLAKLRPLSFSDQSSSSSSSIQDQKKIYRHIPGNGTDWVDDRGEEKCETISSFLVSGLDTDGAVANDFRVPDRVLERWGRLFDIVLPTHRRTCCFTRGYTKLVERTGSILQENQDLDTKSVFDAFLLARENGEPHAVNILRPLGLRYFSPAELLKLFAFDADTFIWPPHVTTKTKYRLIGNSVNVLVVTHLIRYLLC